MASDVEQPELRLRLREAVEPEVDVAEGEARLRAHEHTVQPRVAGPEKLGGLGRHRMGPRRRRRRRGAAPLELERPLLPGGERLPPLAARDDGGHVIVEAVPSATWSLSRGARGEEDNR